MNIYIKEAISQAQKAYKRKEIPIGAVVVKDNKIIAKVYNKRQAKNNVLGHAEIIAILKAGRKLKDWRLFDCELYVTLKPCELCEKVIKESRISKVYYLIERNEDKKAYSGTEFVKVNDIESKEIEDYQNILTSFFENKRISK